MTTNKQVPERLVWTRDLVSRFWDGFAQTRLVEHSFSRNEGRSLLSAIDHLLPRDGIILDFGAGDGHLVELMCERGLRVAAYEPSAERAEHLKRRLGNFDCFQGTEHGSSTKTYDTVILAEVIEHILDEDMEAVLSRVASLTRPGGTLIVTTPNNEDLDLGMCYCPVSNTLFHRWQHVRSFTGTDLESLLARFGFECVTTNEVDFTESFFAPLDPQVGNAASDAPLPDYLKRLRQNSYVKIGNGRNLLYIGRRT